MDEQISLFNEPVDDVKSRLYDMGISKWFSKEEIDAFVNAGYSDEQLEVLLIAIRNDRTREQLALFSPDFTVEQLEVMASCYLSAEQLSKVADPSNPSRFDSNQMKEIISGLLNNRSNKFESLFIDETLCAGAIKEIVTGFAHGLSYDEVSLYANSSFSVKQMEYIRKGLEISDIETVSHFAKPEISPKDMEQILRNLESVIKESDLDAGITAMGGVAVDEQDTEIADEQDTEIADEQDTEIKTYDSDLDYIDDFINYYDFRDVDSGMKENGWCHKINITWLGSVKKDGVISYNTPDGYTIQSNAYDFCKALEEAKELLACEINPNNLVHFLDKNMNVNVLEAALLKKPQLLRYLMPDSSIISKDASDALYSRLSDGFLSSLLSKDGTLLEYIPASRLKAAANNCLCCIAVKQTKDALAFVPKFAPLYDESLQPYGVRGSKIITLVDDNVVDAYLSHSVNDKNMFRDLDDKWVNTNTVLSALKYNFNAIDLMACDVIYRPLFESKKKLAPNEFPLDAVRGSDYRTHNKSVSITVLNPEIYDLIIETAKSDIRKVRSLPDTIYSPKLAMELASLGSVHAKMVFHDYPYRLQLDCLQAKRDAGEIRSSDYALFRDELIKPTLIDDEFAKLFSSYTELANDFDAFSNINTLRNRVELCLTDRNSGHISMNTRDVETLIKGFNWDDVPAYDTKQTVIYEQAKYDIAYRIAETKSDLIPAIYENMYPNGIHVGGMKGVELESRLNEAAVYNDAKCFKYIPNPSGELSMYACDKYPANAVYCSPSVIGEYRWHKSIVEACKSSPEILTQVADTDITPELMKHCIEANYECCRYLSDDMFTPVIVGKERWVDLALDNLSKEPEYIATLEDNAGCTKEFIEMVAEEIPEAMEHLTDKQKDILNGKEKESPVVDLVT